ncbi:hypothetical protein N7523_009068 [Penicillium sp. IBT 18751x]|nr:hypothetical protein N7523_009068 [Penicillium sp. IBT 18751x]
MRIIRTTGLDVDDFSARYFRGIHTFIPILSRPRFHEQLAQAGVPPVAFSGLLLCMCLVTYHPEFTQQLQPIDQDTLYLTAKSLITQVQTSFPPSLPLIQAGVIIAAYEYASGKLHNAVSSIGNCARMGYTIGLHLARPVETADPVPSLQTEEFNTWWGIIICERIFFCELDDFTQPFVSRTTQGSQPEPVTMCQSPPLPQIHPSLPMNRVTISTGKPSLEESIGFSCITQAAYLLDQVFEALEVPDLGSRLIRLDGLDHTLRTFFSVVMDRAEGKWGFFCSANVMAIRLVKMSSPLHRRDADRKNSALYIIHLHVLAVLPQIGLCKYKSPDIWNTTSCAALDSLTKMEAQTATIRSDLPLELIDVLPPSCIYIMRAARQHIENSYDKTKHWCLGDMNRKKACGIIGDDETKTYGIWDAHDEKLRRALAKLEARWNYK